MSVNTKCIRVCFGKISGLPVDKPSSSSRNLFIYLFHISETFYVRGFHYRVVVLTKGGKETAGKLWSTLAVGCSAGVERMKKSSVYTGSSLSKVS